MKPFPWHLALFAIGIAPFLGRAASPSALVNPGFENVLDWNGNPIPPGTVGPIATWGGLPGWSHYGPNSGSSTVLGSYWNINGPNLGMWAEAFILDAADPGCCGSPPYPSLEGRFSVGLISGYPADTALFRDPWTGQPYATTRYIGRAGIAQSIGLPPDITELTCYYTDLSYPGHDEGSLVLKFNQQVLGYTLEPAVGPNGPTTLLRADLTPVAGQYGELRIGIEGRGFFVVDNIVVVPEASTVAGALLVVLAMAAGLARPDRRHRIRSPSPDPADAALSPQAS
ncbi:MAG: hypothetical protein ACKOET_10690, partial [Verrucomicrobiota bacterium]